MRGQTRLWLSLVSRRYGAGLEPSWADVLSASLENGHSTRGLSEDIERVMTGDMSRSTTRSGLHDTRYRLIFHQIVFVIFLPVRCAPYTTCKRTRTEEHVKNRKKRKTCNLETKIRHPTMRLTFPVREHACAVTVNLNWHRTSGWIYVLHVIEFPQQILNTPEKTQGGVFGLQCS